MYYGDKRHGKTAAAKEWSEQVLQALSRYKSELKQFRDYFEPSRHIYSVSIEMLVPHDTLYTKKGELTSKVHDLSNIEKPIVDLLFLPKFFEYCENLNIDDRYLGELRSLKTPTLDTWGVNVIIEIKNKPELKSA